jgi:hypothetical protein
MDYYGLGADNPVQFEQNVFMFLQQMNFRIGDSDFFLGGKYQLSQIKIPEKRADLTLLLWGKRQWRTRLLL